MSVHDLYQTLQFMGMEINSTEVSLLKETKDETVKQYISVF